MRWGAELRHLLMQHAANGLLHVLPQMPAASGDAPAPQPHRPRPQLPLSALEGELMLRYERFELSSSVAGFTYRATGQLLECGAKWLRGLADLARHAPGSSVLDGTGGGSGSGVKEGAATAQQQPAATVVAAAGADGGGGHTPSGSDHSANASWGSGDREAGASGGAAGRSDASICTRSPSAGGGGGMQPARAGQQQGGWPVQICDLFCGCGGLSLGLLQALGPGARVKWAVDFFPEALQTYAQCHPGGAPRSACAWLGPDGRPAGVV